MNKAGTIDRVLYNGCMISLVNNLILAVSVDEGKNATLANQILNSSNGKETFCHGVIILLCDWFCFEYTE